MIPKFEIWLGSLAHYNAGSIHGQWLELPMDEEQLQRYLDKYTNNGQHDFYIADAALPFDVGESTDPLLINRVIERYLDLDERQQTIFDYLVNIENYGFERSFEKLDDVIVYDCESFKDLAMQFLDDGYLPQESLINYFDYEAYGRDLSFSGQFAEHNGRIFELCDYC